MEGVQADHASPVQEQVSDHGGLVDHAYFQERYVQAHVIFKYRFFPCKIQVSPDLLSVPF